MQEQLNYIEYGRGCGEIKSQLQREEMEIEDVNNLRGFTDLDIASKFFNMSRAEYVISRIRQEPVVYVAKKFDEFFTKHLHLHTLVQLAISL